ncbi:MAG: endonuclease III [Desulfobacterota bacterium]|nr:endonuclease III [Thermodesulfobacteriota bacterium]MDW8002610.1 endonuclease III [Deltaproteobacteria bacterium]
MKNVEELIERLKNMHGEPRCELNFSNPLELTVATVLSAQCTDERVNKVTEKLFKKYRSLDDYIAVKIEELEEDIKPTGFFRNKAKTLKNIAEEIKIRFSGKVPEDIDLLASVKGIGRKSANMIVGCAYKKPALIVDTHVKRVANRIGLTDFEDPERIEIDLKKKVPRDRWLDLSLLLILHGRYVCKARKPECNRCELKNSCNFFIKGEK